MHINDLINPASLLHDVQNGFIRVQFHPSLPLRIYNYTEKTQFARHWNKATLASRGLIVHDDGTIIARPFPKFFNLGEAGPKGYKAIDPYDMVSVTDKMDGSLGIMYQAVPKSKTVPRIATRGSFESDQAKHANDVLGSRYPDFYPPDDWTLLFEIIYPENRIVVNYDGMDDLVLLGAVNITTGQIAGPEIAPNWPGPRVEVMTPGTMHEALRMDPRPGKEGIVVRSLFTGQMVKIKQDDYVRMHKIVTGLNQRAVWEMLKDGLNPYEGIPDELHGWVSEVASNLQSAFDDAKDNAEALYYKIVHDLYIKYDQDWTRKDFAMEAKKYLGWAQKTLFLQLDMQPIDEYIWKQLKPTGEENTSVY